MAYNILIMYSKGHIIPHIILLSYSKVLLKEVVYFPMAEINVLL